MIIFSKRADIPPKYFYSFLDLSTIFDITKVINDHKRINIYRKINIFLNDAYHDKIENNIKSTVKTYKKSIISRIMWTCFT